MNKMVNRKYGKFLTNLSEQIPWNKICVDLIDPNKIHRKGRPPINIKYITVINPIMGWFEITQ